MDTSTTTKRTFLSLLSVKSIRNLSVWCRRSFCVILLPGLAACGGGGGGSQSAETTPPPVIANPDTFYLADQDTDGVFELYAALTSSPGASLKLNEALSLPGGEFGHVFEHILAPDDETVIFLADKDTADVRELYTASFSNPGINTKLSGPLPAGHTVTRGFQLNPDGQRVVYRVSSDSGATELYQVRLDTPGVATRVNGPLVSGGDVKRTTTRSLSLL